MARAAKTAKRVRLDQQLIVDGVLELASQDPQSRITFKKLGERLGVDATAMYRHFRSKDELTAAALDRLAGMAVDGAREIEGTWRQRLEAYTENVAALSLKHPSIGAEGAVLEPIGPGDVSSDEFVLEMLSAAGLSGDQLIRAYAALLGFVLSQSAALAQDSMASRDAARDGKIPWISSFGTVDLTHYPHVKEHRDALLAMDGITVYRAGISAILDSVEREVSAAAQPGGG